ncbi:hypothetical protein J6590_011945 [Homalodisca vitripennis]|nr:hypothetical protein J6590_011945 [Homalodisca vitripennis]
MVLSPNGQHLACLHTCGTVSVWLMPSLRLHGLWNLRDQPNFDVQPDNVKKKSRASQLEDFYPVDISWWAEEKVIIARRNGAVSVCELSELRNMLGETPEFVHGEPRLSPVSTQKGILVLECEIDNSQDDNSSSEEEESLVHKSSALVQTTVYLITDMERFQPKRKKAKVQRRTFRLLGIKSTTPDELFSRKIDAGEFDEALQLAHMYNLDTDRVRQSQWRNSPVSEDTIRDYLSEISKKRWVFEECHERVPDTLAAARRLIEFGLKITSIQALADLASDESNEDASVVKRSLYKCGDKGSSFYRIFRPWDYFKKCESLLDEVGNLQNNLLGWNFAIGDVGTVLAILQDSLLEIRTPRDDFSSVVGKATVARDSCQQWRRLCWSPDCSMLALAFSNGAVNFYDLFGSNLFNIPPPSNNKESQIWNPEHSLAGMFFISARDKNQKWPFELILVDYGGNLRSYNISPTEGFVEFHRYSFSKGGVSAVSWDPFHNLLIVSSAPEHKYTDLKRESLGWGISAWRLLNDQPFYRLAVPSAEDIAKVEARRGIVSWVSSFYSSTTFSVVFKMVLSPNGQHLACLHTCGTVSVWLMPSLRLHGLWNLRDQPNFDVQPDNVKKKSRASQLEDFYPVDISWWAEEKVIIARRNGAVSVCELSELRNMLGETPEFVHGEPRLSPVSTQKGILVLECEIDNSQDDNSSSEEEESLVHKSSALVQTTVYLITDMERFQPKRKKAKVQRRTFRLLGIKSTTPDELFSRKIDAGEFDEALQLAHMYNLDTDRVRQSQWRNSPVSEDTIRDYLSEISKKRWVFEECHERVPDTLAAARRLIEFGLKITSIQALADLASDESNEGK